MLRAVHFQMDGSDVERFEEAARAAGYSKSEFARRLLRIGWRYEGEVGRDEGLHFVTAPVATRRARKGGRQRRAGV